MWQSQLSSSTLLWALSWRYLEIQDKSFALACTDVLRRTSRMLLPQKSRATPLVLHVRTSYLLLDQSGEHKRRFICLRFSLSA
jgi:hypothetical protein